LPRCMRISSSTAPVGRAVGQKVKAGAWPALVVEGQRSVIWEIDQLGEGDIGHTLAKLNADYDLAPANSRHGSVEHLQRIRTAEPLELNYSIARLSSAVPSKGSRPTGYYERILKGSVIEQNQCVSFAVASIYPSPRPVAAKAQCRPQVDQTRSLMERLSSAAQLPPTAVLNARAEKAILYRSDGTQRLQQMRA
jgi:hypothetical protein